MTWTVGAEGKSKLTYTITDKAGNKTVCGKIEVQKDSKPPVCTLKSDGGNTINGWYTQNVKVSFASKNDVKSKNEDISGLASYGIGTSKNYQNQDGTQIDDTNSNGVNWNGYVKDKAGNEGSCGNSINIKKDTTDPTCTLSIDGTRGNPIQYGHWYIDKNVKITLNSSDASSGVASKGISKTNYSLNGTTSLELKHDDDAYVYGHVKDGVGRVGSCITERISVDTKKPSCDWDGDSTSWTKNNRKIKLYCDSDEGSGCKDGAFWEHNYTDSIETDEQTHEITDYAGNKETCSKKLNVYVDKDGPTHKEVCVCQEKKSATCSGYDYILKMKLHDSLSGLKDSSWKWNSAGNATPLNNTDSVTYGGKKTHYGYICVSKKGGAYNYTINDVAGNSTTGTKYLNNTNKCAKNACTSHDS